MRPVANISIRSLDLYRIGGLVQCSLTSKNLLRRTEVCSLTFPDVSSSQRLRWRSEADILLVSASARQWLKSTDIYDRESRWAPGTQSKRNREKWSNPNCISFSDLCSVDDRKMTKNKCEKKVEWIGAK